MRKNKARRPGSRNYTKTPQFEMPIRKAPKGYQNTPSREIGTTGTQQARMPDFSKVGQNGHRHFG